MLNAFGVQSQLIEATWRCAVQVSTAVLKTKFEQWHCLGSAIGSPVRLLKNNRHWPLLLWTFAFDVRLCVRAKTGA